MTRLPKSPTQRIDQAKPLSFSYRGQAMQGYEGDSVASAMYGAGVRIFSRSLKYHRPRGLYSLDGESANTLMDIDAVPNERAETTLLKAGMHVSPQNVKGSPESDFYGFIDKLDGFMPAGFYYRMFHKPAALVPFFIKRIRQMAGIGVLDATKLDVSRFKPAELYLNAEVCVLGGGPAGLQAALAAAESGLRVVLIEGRPWLGGYYDWRTRELDGVALTQRARDLAAKLTALPNVRVFTHTFINNLCGDNLVTAFQVGGADDHFTQRYLEVRAHSVVVATGGLERALVFEHNERPGVMQVACAHRLARTYGVLPGNQAVFSVADDLGLEAALDLASLGAAVPCVADARKEGHDPALVAALGQKGIKFLPGWVACATEGDKTVKGAALASLDGVGTSRFACDLLVASAGLAPNSGPFNTIQVKLAFDPHTFCFLPKSLPPRLHAAGRVLGYADPAAVEASGRLAGLKAAADFGADLKAPIKAAEEALASLPGPAKGAGVVAAPNLGEGRKSFVCFDEDATVKALKQSIFQGFDAPELAKRFSACGTGPGQGGVPGPNLPLVMARLRGEEPTSGLLPTTVRSPLVPTLMSTYAGPGHDIYKRTGLHDSQLKLGAIMRRAGVWMRARYFSQDFTCKEEVKNVRENVGLIDVSSLGKFRLYGPDAEKALQRVYIGNMGKVPTGKLKYTAMCNYDGQIVDDGVVTKLGENDYYLTTSSNRAGQTIEWFRYYTRDDGWDFALVNLTDALGALNLAGPNARKVLAKLTDADVSNEALPYMGFTELMLGGKVPAKVLRVGFVGEMGYELHIPTSYLQTAWDLLWEAGQEFGIKPFGLEAQFVLRLEKGHVIIGQETEQRTTLTDLGMGFLWDKKDYASKKIGAPALRFAEDQPGRLKLVGFKVEEPGAVPGDGATVYEGTEIRGFVASCRQSVALGHAVGLALMRDDLVKKGRFGIFQSDGKAEQRFTGIVVPTPFYDPEGRRLKM